MYHYECPECGYELQTDNAISMIDEYKDARRKCEDCEDGMLELMEDK